MARNADVMSWRHILHRCLKLSCRNQHVVPCWDLKYHGCITEACTWFSSVAKACFGKTGGRWWDEWNFEGWFVVFWYTSILTTCRNWYELKVLDHLYNLICNIRVSSHDLSNQPFFRGGTLVLSPLGISTPRGTGQTLCLCWRGLEAVRVAKYLGGDLWLRNIHLEYHISYTWYEIDPL